MLDDNPIKQSWSRTDWLLISVLVPIAFAIRLVGIEQDGLWWDEISTWYEAVSGIGSPQQAPLSAWITGHFMDLMNSANTVTTKFPALFLSTISVPLTYYFVRLWDQRQIAFLSALFIAASPLVIYYGIQARPYGILQAAVVSYAIIIYWYWQARTFKCAIYLVSSTAILMLTHAVAALPIAGLMAALFFYDLFRGRWSQACKGLILACVGVVLGSFWMWSKPRMAEVLEGQAPLIIYSYLVDTLTVLNSASYEVKTVSQLVYLLVIVAFILALLGAYRLVVEGKFFFLLLCIIPIIVTLTVLFFTLGRKGEWSNWPRYISFLPIFYSPLFVKGTWFAAYSIRGIWPLARRDCATSLLTFAIAFPVLLQGTIIVINRPNSEEDSERKRAAEHSDRSAIVGALFPFFDFGYGDEAERSLAYYFRHSTRSDVPAYYVKDRSIYKTELRDAKYGLPRILAFTSIPHSNIPNGLYAVFPRFMPGCSSIEDLHQFRIEMVYMESDVYALCLLTRIE